MLYVYNDWKIYLGHKEQVQPCGSSSSTHGGDVSDGVVIVLSNDHQSLLLIFFS